MTFLSVIAGLAVLGLVAQAPSAPSAGSEAEIPPSAASSQPLSPGAAAENPPADEGGRDAPRSEKKKKKSERAHAVSLEARLDVRGIQTRAEPRQLGEPTPPRAYGIGVSRAQLELGYRYQKWLGLVVQADLAALPGLRPMYEWPAEDGPEPAEGFALEDAYARIGDKQLAVRVGYFKPPVSGVELASSWELPVARRGVIHSTLVDYMRFAGRRPGVQVEWAVDVPLEPKLRAGVFQGSEVDGTLLRTVGVYETNLAARASIQPGPVEVGVSGTLIGTPPYAGARIGRYWLVGADARLESPLGPFDARVWYDVAHGLSFHGLYGDRGQDARFVAGRALLAFRLGGRESGSKYAELFGMAEGVNFDLVADHRTVSGYVVGINAGWWDRLRLTLGMERRDVGIYSPLLTDGGNQLRERTVFIVQLGGALDERWRF